MKATRKLSWLMLLVLIVSLVLTACGGEKATDTPRPAAPTATSAPAATKPPEPTKEPVAEFECIDEFGCVTVEKGERLRLASVLVLTGANASLGLDSQRGVEIAIDHRGDVMGFPIELVAEDGQCSAEGGQTAATKVSSDETIVAVVGHNCSSSCQPASEIYEQAGFTMVSPSCTSPSLTGYLGGTHVPSFMRTTHQDLVQGKAAAEFFYNALGMRSAATIHDGSPYADDLQRVFADRFEELGGTITAREAVNVGDTDMRPLLTSIAVDDPDMIYYPIFIAEGGHITTQAREIFGEDIVLAGADGMISPDFVSAAGDAGEGMYHSGPNTSFKGALFERFLADHIAKYGERPISAFHAHAYDAANIIFDAIEKVGVLDAEGNLHIGRKALRDALYATTGFQGITGSLSCDDVGDCADPSIQLSQLQGGEYVPIWNDRDGFLAEAPMEEEDLLDQVMGAGKLVVSTDPNYAPQSFLDENGELDGFDVKVAEEVAERLGVEVEFVTPDWALITAGNWGGRWDLSIGSMTITEDRMEILWFTQPYYFTPAAFAVHKDNTDIQTPADFGGKTVGLGEATTYEAYLGGTLSIVGETPVYDAPSGVTRQTYTTDAEAIEDLALGDGVRLDGVMSAQQTIQEAIDQGLPLKFVGTPAFYEPLAFALDKSRGPSDGLVDKLNEILDEMHADGTLTELALEFYGVDISKRVEPGEEVMMGEETLIFAQSADAGTLDPALETSANSLAPVSHIYEGLTAFEPGSTTPIPALATSWEATPDSLEWTFNLREGVTFHDGTPFDADAAVFNFERWWDTDNPYNAGADQFIYWDYMFQGFKGDENSVLAGIEKIDDMTFKLILSKPNASLLNTLAMENFRFASPTAVMEQGDTYGTAEGLAVGTGPFKVEEWLKEDHLTLVRNDDYWGKAPSLKRIEYRVIPDTSAAFLALQAGDIDAISLWASPGPDDIAVALEDPNLQVIYNPAFNVGYLGLNHGKEWLQNENVRLAIAHAIDKHAIVDSLYPGDAETASQFQPPALWGYNDDIEDYPYDPALAQEFLQAAIDEGVEIPDPVIFYVMPVSRAYYPQPQPTGELIQAFLAEIGINTEIQSPAWPDPYLSDLEEDGTKHDLFMLGWVGDNGDPDNFLCVFFCGGDTTFNNDGTGGGLPPDEEIAQMLRDAVSETDFATRKAMYELINQMIHDRIISVPVVHRTPPTLFRANISGYVPSPIREDLTYLEKK